jgi:hypothetical protein
VEKVEASKEVLLDGAQMFISGTIAAIAGFLKQRNIPLKDFFSYMGDKFEGAFGDLEDRGVDEVMKHLLTLEVLPLGAEVISSRLTPEQAEVMLTPLPSKAVLEKFGTTPRELLSGFGITQKEYESVYDSYAPAAKAIGLRFRHALKDGQEILSLEKASRKA